MTGAHRPVLIVIAGPNGSGKTTITRQLAADGWLDGVAVLNPDEIAQQRFGGWDSREASLQAAQFVEAEREDALANGTSLAFETVLSAPDKPAYVRRALAAGFFVRFFICTDHPSINASRVASRVLVGGHTVDTGKVIARWTKSVANAATVLPLVHRAYVFDNTQDRAAARLLFRTETGRMKRIAVESRADWAQLLASSVVAQEPPPTDTPPVEDPNPDSPRPALKRIR